MSNDDVVDENEKKILTSGEESYDPETNNEMHLSIERGRRKKMKEMFDDLSALLPQLPSKADKATVVNEAVDYIKVLQETLEKLERKKKERAQHVLKQIMGTSSNAGSVSEKQKGFDKTWAASNMVLNIRGNEAQFSICSVHKPGLMTNIASVLEKHNIELISATISANGNGSTCMIQVHGKQASDANSMEETYRKAAEEIMPWIS
ncbi:transcription factor bHLH95-like [Vigna umbellata]|uniref:transcription factor bHLH95-like n=1 Tax=Vigna umbellata TaxID=87088 RepID=UPI001F5FF017|nr:transcription factor bHLH95-like [Vigna umbellata]